MSTSQPKPHEASLNARINELKERLVNVDFATEDVGPSIFDQMKSLSSKLRNLRQQRLGNKNQNTNQFPSKRARDELDEDGDDRGPNHKRRKTDETRGKGGKVSKGRKKRKARERRRLSSNQMSSTEVARGESHGHQRNQHHGSWGGQTVNSENMHAGDQGNTNGDTEGKAKKKSSEQRKTKKKKSKSASKHGKKSASEAVPDRTQNGLDRATDMDWTPENRPEPNMTSDQGANEDLVPQKDKKAKWAKAEDSTAPSNSTEKTSKTAKILKEPKEPKDSKEFKSQSKPEKVKSKKSKSKGKSDKIPTTPIREDSDANQDCADASAKSKKSKSKPKASATLTKETPEVNTDLPSENVKSGKSKPKSKKTPTPSNNATAQVDPDLPDKIEKSKKPKLETKKAPKETLEMDTNGSAGNVPTPIFLRPGSAVPGTLKSKTTEFTKGKSSAPTPSGLEAPCAHATSKEKLINNAKTILDLSSGESSSSDSSSESSPESSATVYRKESMHNKDDIDSDSVVDNDSDSDDFDEDRDSPPSSGPWMSGALPVGTVPLSKTCNKSKSPEPSRANVQLGSYSFARKAPITVDNTKEKSAKPRQVSTAPDARSKSQHNLKQGSKAKAPEAVELESESENNAATVAKNLRDKSSQQSKDRRKSVSFNVTPQILGRSSRSTATKKRASVGATRIEESKTSWDSWASARNEFSQIGEVFKRPPPETPVPKFTSATGKTKSASVPVQTQKSKESPKKKDDPKPKEDFKSNSKSAGSQRATPSQRELPPQKETPPRRLRPSTLNAPAIHVETDEKGNTTFDDSTDMYVEDESDHDSEASSASEAHGAMKNGKAITRSHSYGARKGQDQRQASSKSKRNYESSDTGLWLSSENWGSESALPEIGASDEEAHSGSRDAANTCQRCMTDGASACSCGITVPVPTSRQEQRSKLHDYLNTVTSLRSSQPNPEAARPQSGSGGASSGEMAKNRAGETSASNSIQDAQNVPGSFPRPGSTEILETEPQISSNTRQPTRDESVSASESLRDWPTTPRWQLQAEADIWTPSKNQGNFGTSERPPGDFGTPNPLATPKRSGGLFNAVARPLGAVLGTIFRSPNQPNQHYHGLPVRSADRMKTEPNDGPAHPDDHGASGDAIVGGVDDNPFNDTRRNVLHSRFVEASDDSDISSLGSPMPTPLRKRKPRKEPAPDAESDFERTIMSQRSALSRDHIGRFSKGVLETDPSPSKTTLRSMVASSSALPDAQRVDEPRYSGGLLDDPEVQDALDFAHDYLTGRSTATE